MTDRTRFTISISNETKNALDQLKQEKYYNTTRNEMINDLIILGLQTYHKEKEKQKEEVEE